MVECSCFSFFFAFDLGECVRRGGSPRAAV